MKYLNLINLPADFRTSPVHVKLQAVRLTRDQGDPEVELDETIAPTSGSSRSICLGPNEFAFLELSSTGLLQQAISRRTGGLAQGRLQVVDSR